ncbi:hypothetical protein [Rhodococcus sp. H29-C3]|uniref:hypothetical protein n=1 Tax=Rhodococcus sp. H29-C3 TaxID=3046307 RepID=UPI0024B919B6|nr:hypothetical protein [Rhodococcus sp. H29-C3]MDJ0363335.1 hypothetical protein [Rhodococcus sp. H29-C3]
MSTTPALDRDTVMARARDAALSRTKYIESLFDAAGAASAAREKVDEAARAADRADTEHAAAYQEAIDAGWTAAELTASGLPAPTPVNKKPSRSKAAKRSSSRASSPARRRVGIVAQSSEHDDDTNRNADTDTAPLHRDGRLSIQQSEPAAS